MIIRKAGRARSKYTLEQTMRILLRLALLLGLSWGNVHVNAAQYALLVGVSNYPFLPKLQGSANDVQLMRDVLSRLGFERDRIHILADNVNGASLPTRVNILAALDQLVNEAKVGDQIYLHFSGHGSQQLATPEALAWASEPDGLSETFLPIDVGRANGGQVAPNAITDYEFGRSLGLFLAKGVFVWCVFDTSHSANMRRNLEVNIDPDADEAVRRYINPLELGLPSVAEMTKTATERHKAQVKQTVVSALNNKSDKSASPSGQGGYVTFYASRAAQIEEEWPMPRGLAVNAPGAKKHGLLTWFLAEALQDFNGGSYQQLGQNIQQRYLANGIADRITPVFSGDSLNDSVFLPGHESGTRQWLVEPERDRLVIGAGRLHQITEGSEFILLPNGLADDSQALAHAVASKVDALDSELQLLPGEDGKIIALSRDKLGMVARQVRPNPSLVLNVAVDTNSEKSHPAFANVIDHLRKRPPPGLQLAWSVPGKLADIKLFAENNRIWMVSPGTRLRTQGKTLSPNMAMLESTEKASGLLAENLLKAARAINLVRVVDAIKGQDALSVKLNFQVTIKRGKNEPKPLEKMDSVRDGDFLCWRAENRGTVPFDLSILLLDAHFNIDLLYPWPDSGPNRIAENSEMGECGDIQIQAPFGIDSLLIFAVPERIGAQASDLSFLTQNAVRTRGKPMSDLAAMLAGAVFGDLAIRGTTRDADLGKKPGHARAAVQLVQWKSQPAKEEGVVVDIPSSKADD